MGQSQSLEGERVFYTAVENTKQDDKDIPLRPTIRTPQNLSTLDSKDKPKKSVYFAHKTTTVLTSTSLQELSEEELSDKASDMEMQFKPNETPVSKKGRYKTVSYQDGLNDVTKKLISSDQSRLSLNQN